jgi:hypothetical protein
MRILSFILLIAWCATSCVSAQAQRNPAPEPCAAKAKPRPASALPKRTGDLHDFDFLAGSWAVSNRRLKARGVHSKEWEEFPATACGRTHLDSIANVDEIYFPTKGWGGVTLRAFDTETKQWAIYWVNSRQGKLFPAVFGGFDGDRGEFYGEDDDDGRPVKVRFVWTKIGTTGAHWEQAFSYDGGKTWEVNWMNDFVRADPSVCDEGRPRKQ